MTSRGACSTRITGTWRAVSTTSSSLPTNEHHGLEKLITKAEQRYTEVGSELAKQFITHFQKAKHPIKGLLRQRDIFEKQVKPLLGEGKVAYVWVDALRFEMARELCRLLKDDFKLGDSARHRHDTHDHRNRHGGVIAQGSTSPPRWWPWEAANWRWRSAARSSRIARIGWHS